MEQVDVLIVGAGISGIGAAVHLAARCPELRVVILEASGELGGTWQLFRYPGVRSDSDMHTLGFSFRPWSAVRAMVDGEDILRYLQDTAREHALLDRLRCGHRVQRASWSSETARWTVTASQRDTGRVVQLSCRFLYMCTGYYDPERGHEPAFAGVERYRGRIVHPQRWPRDLEHAGKQIVVIGSGATAVSLVPALAETAAHVALLQRSPSYVVALPSVDPLVAGLGGGRWVTRLARWRNIVAGQLMFQLCRKAPRLARWLLLRQTRRALAGSCEVEPHFSPRYAPWRQRLCVARDGDLFEAMRSGRASIVTGEIAGFSEAGVTLTSGQLLPADIVVTATGLELQLLGSIELVLDGVPCDASKSLSHRGMMFSGIPNLVSSFGYSNASWTLRSELTAIYVCRLLTYMRRRGYAQCRPRPAPDVTRAQPLVELSSSYVERGLHLFPRQGSRAPWRMRQSYSREWLELRWARFSDGSLEFSPEPLAQTALDAAREGQPA